MPLHLLHHKSYHVYSAQNTERVRRDEAAARAAEQAREQRMQEADAEHRIAVLRARAEGRSPPPPPEEEGGSTGRGSRRGCTGGRGATDTDATDTERRPAGVPLTGADGHIDLFSGHRRAGKGAEHEAERKRRGQEAAAGQCVNGLGRPEDQDKRGPWYSSLEGPGSREKTEREERREERRKEWGDPLAVVRKGVMGVRAVEEERREWRRGREGVLAGLVGVERGRERGEREGRGRSPEGRRRSRSPERDKGRHRHRYRSRSRSRPRPRSKDRSSGHHRRHSSHSRHHHSHDDPRRTSRNRHHRHHHHSRSRSREDTNAMGRLRRERDAREAAERRKAEDMLRREKEYRTPGWTAAAGGRYSSQFGAGEVRRRREG